MVDAWTKVSGKKVMFETTSDEDFNYCGSSGKEDLEWTLAQMHEKLTSWEEFL